MNGDNGRCASCAREVRVTANSSAGRMCSACYARSRKTECSRCGGFQPPYTRDPDGRSICKACVWRERSAAETAARRASAVAVVRTVEAELDEASIVAAVAAAAPNIRHARWLSEALARGPEALLGGSVPPPVVDRLVAELLAVGATTVVMPSCFGCGTTRRVTLRVNGLRACNWCAIKARPEVCTHCGREAPVSTRDAEGRAICYCCRQRDPATFEECAGCGRLRKVNYRKADGRGLCSPCGRARGVVECSVCGKIRALARGARGEPRCGSCSRQRATCSGCGSPDAVVAMVFATGPVCSTCHKKALSAKGTCKGCGQRRRIDPRDRSQRGLCSDCAGLEPWSVCSLCRTEDRVYESGRCIACSLEHRLRELLGQSPLLDPLLDSLVASERPRAALRWLAKPETQEVLAAMAEGRLAVTHEALDGRPASGAREHLRQVLVSAGALPARDEQLARLEAWVEEQIGALEAPEDRKVFEAFAKWWILKRYRGRVDRKGQSSDSHARRKILAASAFLEWLRHHDVTLRECTQSHVELWLAGPPGRRHARDFLRWACRHRLASNVDIVRRPDSLPGRSANADDHLALARRFATDDNIPLVDRVAGLLLLCYGQSLARLVRLKAADVSEAEDGDTVVRFGRSRLVLAEPIGRLVHQLVTNPHRRATTGAPDVNPWLFGGGQPGRAMSADHLGLRLAAYGIDAREARTSLLLDLAAELAPAFLADLLGMHPGTAVRWVRAAGGDWAGYVAARARG